MSERAASPTDVESGFTLAEVANHLQVTPETLRQWNQRFAQFLVTDVTSVDPRYSTTDVAALLVVQKLLEQGYDDDAVSEQLTPKRLEIAKVESVTLTPQQRHLLREEAAALLPHVVSDMLSTIANSQQTVLNSQSTMREMVGVVVQDNFNLKEENRKLRDRMLEMERALAEYQRREETRKERMESRMRALESTVSALQQQVAQLVQRQRQKRRSWFG